MCLGEYVEYFTGFILLNTQANLSVIEIIIPIL